MTFFHCANASRSIKLSSGKRVTFDVYKYFAGSWLGVAAVEDAETIDGLDELVFKLKSGITRITQAEYEADLKKKARAPSLRLSPALPSPLQAAILPVGGPAGRPAVVVNSLDSKAPSPTTPIPAPRVFDSLDEVLKIGVVKPVDIEGPVPPKKDMGQRSDRATGRPSRRPKYRSDDVLETEDAA